MKKVVIFVSGFVSCLLFMIFFNNSIMFSSAEQLKYEFTKVDYPIYANEVLQENIEAYNYNGFTYIKIRDLNDMLNNVSIQWNKERKEAHLSDLTGLGVIEKDGKKYIDLRYIVKKYVNGRLPYWFDHDGFCKPNGEFVDLNRYHGNNYVLYHDYELVKKELLPLLSEIIIENEQFILDNPDYESWN